MGQTLPVLGDGRTPWSRGPAPEGVAGERTLGRTGESPTWVLSHTDNALSATGRRGGREEDPAGLGTRDVDGCPFCVVEGPAHPPRRRSKRVV